MALEESDISLTEFRGKTSGELRELLLAAQHRRWQAGVTAEDMEHGGDARPRGQDGELLAEDQEQYMDAMRCKSPGDMLWPTSWQDALARFPSLLRLYPLAAPSEAGLEEDGTVATESLAIEEDHPAPTATSPSANGAQVTLVPSSASNPSSPAARWSRQSFSPQSPRGARSPRSPRSGAEGGQRSPVSVGQGRAGTVPDPPDEAWRASASELAAAWAEVEDVRRGLADRERVVARREAAVRSGEARNHATARELGELRQRLEAYGEELEQGVVSLAAKEHAVREEWRRTSHLQARVQRMCATTVRDRVLAGSWRDAGYDGRGALCPGWGSAPLVGISARQP